MDEIGYLSISVTATTPGRHLATFPPGGPNFGYSTPKRYSSILPHYPKMAGCSTTAAQRPTTPHSTSCLLILTKTDKNRLRDVHALLLKIPWRIAVEYNNPSSACCTYILYCIEHARTFIRWLLVVAMGAHTPGATKADARVVLVRSGWGQRGCVRS